jgi:hypothetical protein
MPCSTWQIQQEFPHHAFCHRTDDVTGTHAVLNLAESVGYALEFELAAKTIRPFSVVGGDADDGGGYVADSLSLAAGLARGMMV